MQQSQHEPNPRKNARTPSTARGLWKGKGKGNIMVNDRSINFSRRSFLRGGAALGAIAAAGGMLAACGTPQAPSPSDPGSADAASTVEHPDAEPIAPALPPEQWDAETDVIVVGSGSGGITAAALLSANNVPVMLCEKEGKTGGASRHAGGVGNPFGG